MHFMNSEAEYPEDSILVIGNSRTTEFNPINQQFGAFFITFILDGDEGKILDCGASATVRTTERFIRSLFMGRRMTEDEEEIIAHVQSRYFGSSQKAIIAAYRDALKKYREVKGLKKIN